MKENDAVLCTPHSIPTISTYYTFIPLITIAFYSHKYIQMKSIKTLLAALFCASILIIVGNISLLKTQDRSKVTPKLVKTYKDNNRVVYLIELGEHQYSLSTWGDNFEYADAEHTEDCPCGH